MRPSEASAVADISWTSRSYWTSSAGMVLPQYSQGCPVPFPAQRLVLSVIARPCDGCASLLVPFMSSVLAASRSQCASVLQSCEWTPPLTAKLPTTAIEGVQQMDSNWRYLGRCLGRALVLCAG